MNIVDAYRRCPEQVLDRLVDGELGLEERRALLGALDEEPGAWRRCALAFLEAQAWGGQLARAAHEPLVARAVSATAADSKMNRSGWAAWSLTLAASVLVAFVLGRLWADRTDQGTLVTRGATEQVPSLVNKLSTPTAVAQTTGEEPASEPETPASATLRLYGNDEASELPLVESNDNAALVAADRSQAVSGALVQHFERDGFEVNRQQGYWPFELPDGRRVLVPIEELRIQSPQVERL